MNIRLEGRKGRMSSGFVERVTGGEIKKKER
jgi:hypothetical protein